MIAALFVETGGAYFAPEFDPYDIKRDARTFRGGATVIAHPPCQRWCRLAGLVEARWGHKVGDDGGLFAFALAAVRANGGVLEHPAYSKAWAAYGLPRPSRNGGWVAGAGGWTCHVEQGRYGHAAKKATWLFAAGGVGSPPELRWGSTPDSQITHTVSWCGNKLSRATARPRLGKRAAIATPPEFQAALVEIAKWSQKTS